MLRIILLASCVALASCATITRGTKTAFVVETIPSGARVELSSGQVCEATPCTLAGISREAEFTVTVSRNGYRTTTHQVTHATSGGGGAGMAGNVLVGGLIGGVIDANSGATQNLVPNPLVVHMEQDTTPVSQPTPASAPEAVAPQTVAEPNETAPAEPLVQQPPTQ